MELWQLALIIIINLLAIFAKSFIISIGAIISCLYGIYIATTLTGDPNIYFVEAIFLVIVAFQILYVIRAVKHF